MLTDTDIKALRKTSSPAYRLALLIGLPTASILWLIASAICILAASRYATTQGLSIYDILVRSFPGPNPTQQYSGAFVLAVGRLQVAVIAFVIGASCLSVLPFTLHSLSRRRRILHYLETHDAVS